MIDVNQIINVQFGVSVGDVTNYIIVPTNADVQGTLIEILQNTQLKVNDAVEGLRVYEPSEKYGTNEQLTMELNDDNLEYLRTLFSSISIPTDSQPIENYIRDVKFYFAFFHMADGSRVLGVKRPAVFKSLLKSRNYILRWTDDTLTKVDDNVFKLDNEFDYYVRGGRVYINQPSGFQYTTQIEEFVQASAYHATLSLATRVPFIRFNVLADFVRNSKTSAKLIASIKKRNDLEQIDRGKLIRFCKKLKIQLEENSDGSIHPVFEDKYQDFLMVLDRRLFEYNLISSVKELYEAQSRVFKQS
jgi:hypothetical protein